MECKIIKQNTEISLVHAVKEQFKNNENNIISINIIKEGNEFTAMIWYKN